MTRRYVILDVFTSTIFEGNPLAVVLDGDGLSDEQMQLITAEFGLSETVFVQQPTQKVHSASIRIFTPKQELPFAGHPTVGTAALLAYKRNGITDCEGMNLITLEEKIGVIRAAVCVKESGLFAEFDLPQKAVKVEQKLENDLLANALGLSSADVWDENYRPRVYSAGVPFVFVPVKDVEAIRAIRLNKEVMVQALKGGEAHGIFVYTRSGTDSHNDIHARMFAPSIGVDEDPATGSAVAALSGVLVEFDQPLDGHYIYTIKQGYEMGRPSQIHLEMDVNQGVIDNARIGGHCVIVAEGELYV